MNNMSTGMKLATMIIMVTFLYLFAVTFVPMTGIGEDHSKTIVGFLLGTVFGTLINFYYGKKHEQPPTIEERRK